jgi:hypothetical protein
MLHPTCIQRRRSPSVLTPSPRATIPTIGAHLHRGVFCSSLETPAGNHRELPASTVHPPLLPQRVQ